ncbi:MAG: hypothetical protein E4G94_02675 [ANME-2 cluster archaeon]|nr:MAG: hypothetical protein E4G94_02675 [ANME-2 cluster archaeon]
MTIKTIYIDDDDKELKKYQRLFSEDDRSKNKFIITSINTQQPTLSNLINEINQKKPDLILIDFDLSKPRDNVLLGMSGTALSTILKETIPNIPMVLFTRKGVFNVGKYSRQILTSLDGLFYKNEVFKTDQNTLDDLYELAMGFKKLRDKPIKKWNDLLAALKAPKSAFDSLKLSNPPQFLDNTSSLSDIFKWIQEVLLNYPGILYDSIHAATFLGLSENEFLKDETNKIFGKAKYSGIFLPTEDRWWKSELRSIAISKMIKKEKAMALHLGFPVALERIKKTPVELSKCVHSNEVSAEWVCYILNKPVKIKYTLLYRPDSRPNVMYEARVSFKAIRTSNEVNGELFDPLGKEMLKEIRD